MSYTVIKTCDKCKCKMVVVAHSIGNRPMIGICTRCAAQDSDDGTAEPTIHNQCAKEDKYGVEYSMFIGVRVIANTVAMF